MILPTVAEVGGRVRVSAEVIDPHTQTTVYAESADGVGAGSALGSIDKVTGELREKLGEAIASDRTDSAPLPKVSTTNLDALKAYALGNANRAKGSDQGRAGVLQARGGPGSELRARRDSRCGQMYGKSRRSCPAARREMERANKLRDHLSAREKLLLDAEPRSVRPRRSRNCSVGGRWSRAIPDSHLAQFVPRAERHVLCEPVRCQRWRREGCSSATIRRAAPHAVFLQGMLRLGLEQYAEGDRAFDSSRSSARTSTRARFDQMYPYAAQREFDASWKRCLRSRKGSGVPPTTSSAVQPHAVRGRSRQVERSQDGERDEAVDAAKAASPSSAGRVARPSDRCASMCLTGRSDRLNRQEKFARRAGRA